MIRHSLVSKKTDKIFGWGQTKRNFCLKISSFWSPLKAEPNARKQLNRFFYLRGLSIEESSNCNENIVFNIPVNRFCCNK